MPALLDNIDPNGLEEFSVVFTDRSLNHMSKEFQQVMCDLSSNLKEVYSANAVALVPGGGTFAMEAVARQFGNDASVLVVRNGWFSYRWSQIFESSASARATTVVKARMVGAKLKDGETAESNTVGSSPREVNTFANNSFMPTNRTGYFYDGLDASPKGALRRPFENSKDGSRSLGDSVSKTFQKARPPAPQQGHDSIMMN